MFPSRRLHKKKPCKSESLLTNSSSFTPLCTILIRITRRFQGPTPWHTWQKVGLNEISKRHGIPIQVLLWSTPGFQDESSQEFRGLRDCSSNGRRAQQNSLPSLHFATRFYSLYDLYTCWGNSVEDPRLWLSFEPLHPSGAAILKVLC